MWTTSYRGSTYTQKPLYIFLKYFWKRFKMMPVFAAHRLGPHCFDKRSTPFESRFFITKLCWFTLCAVYCWCRAIVKLLLLMLMTMPLYFFVKLLRPHDVLWPRRMPWLSLCCFSLRIVEKWWSLWSPPSCCILAQPDQQHRQPCLSTTLSSISSLCQILIFQGF